MASRAVKVTFGIVGGVVGLILLAIIAIILWVVFRPLNAGDYNSVRADIDILVDLNSFPLEGMVATVGAPTSADTAENLNNRITNTLSQTEVLQETVGEALGSTAVSKDDELRALVEKLDASYTELSTTLQDWSAEGYALIGAAAKECSPSGQYDDAACDAAVGAAEEASPTSRGLTQLLDAARAAREGDPEGLAPALEAFGEETGQLWAPIPTTIEEIETYLDEHTDG